MPDRDDDREDRSREIRNAIQSIIRLEHLASSDALYRQIRERDREIKELREELEQRNKRKGCGAWLLGLLGIIGAIARFLMEYMSKGGGGVAGE
jgi:hypothetical protein